MKKRTKIVCTIGPSCETVDMITRLMRAGMNVVRLNFSHGTHEWHEKIIERVRTIEAETGEPVAIMQDLQGPKIRVGDVSESGVRLIEKETITFDTKGGVYTGTDIPVDYPDLHTFVKPGERLLLDDGSLEVMLQKVEGTKMTGTVVVGGVLRSHKGMNLPDSKLSVRALTEKDKADLRFGIEQGVDLIAVSFVRGPEDILDVRYLAKTYVEEFKRKDEVPVRIIAKIERHEAVKNIEEILAVADGIMVARGDLGVEIPAQDVPLVQKKLIDTALMSGKPVIVATQMLDSMQRNPRPTRAEVSDVANAVLDHADAVMLSNETATGNFPVEAVTTMTNIIHEAERSAYGDLLIRDYERKSHSVDDAVSQVARLMAEKTDAALILAASLSGETGHLISRYRPKLPIVVATASERVRRQLNLSWGVVPFLLPECQSIEELVERGLVYIKQHHLGKSGDTIIVVAGEPVGHAGHVNLLEVRTIPE